MGLRWARGGGPRDAAAAAYAFNWTGAGPGGGAGSTAAAGRQAADADGAWGCGQDAARDRGGGGAWHDVRGWGVVRRSGSAARSRARDRGYRGHAGHPRTHDRADPGPTDRPSASPALPHP